MSSQKFVFKFSFKTMSPWFENKDTLTFISTICFNNDDICGIVGKLSKPNFNKVLLSNPWDKVFFYLLQPGFKGVNIFIERPH